MSDPTYTLTGAQLQGFGATPDQYAQFATQAPTPSSGGGGFLSSLFGGGNNNAPGGAQNANGFNTQIGANVGTLQAGFGGLQTLGNLWSAWNANELANKSFDFQKNLASDNYTNQSTAYNTNLNNAEVTRASMNGTSAADQAAYLKANQLKTTI